MIDVTEERDIDSLFTGGTTTALTQTIAGLDDFELIAFLVRSSIPSRARPDDRDRFRTVARSGTVRPRRPKTKFYEHAKSRPRRDGAVRRRGPAHHLGVQARRRQPSTCAATTRCPRSRSS